MLANKVEPSHDLEFGNQQVLSAYCFVDWFRHKEELPQITVVHLAQDFNLQNRKSNWDEQDVYREDVMNKQKTDQ
jgi:hypothetical protein